MPAPPEPKVTSNSQPWSTSVAIADAVDALYDREAGITAVLGSQPYPDAYEFANGRRFKDGPKPNGGG